MIQLKNFTDYTIDVMHEVSISGEFEKGFMLLEQHKKVLATELEPDMFHESSLVFLDVKNSNGSYWVNYYIPNSVTICQIHNDGEIDWIFNTIGELIDKVGSVKVPDNYIELLKI